MVCAIAEAGSVTKAAAALGLAQPALAAQLKRIERTLGGPLFVRDRRGTSPTPLGDLVLARARVLLPAVNELRDEASELVSAGETARYRIGAGNGPIAGGLVRRLAGRHPSGQVSIQSSWSENELAESVLAGRLDYALVGACAGAVPAPGADLVWRAVAVDAVWVLLSQRHPLAARDEVALAELSAEQWVTAPGDGCFFECFAAACARSGFSPRPAYEMDVGSVADLVASGSVVALCQATARDIAGIVAVPLVGTPLSWRHLLGWNPLSVGARTAGEVFELAAQAYLEVIAQRPRYARWLAAHPGFGAQEVTAPLAAP